MLTIGASITVLKRLPNQIVPLGAFLLYAIGRSIGIASPEPRFMEMEVVWGIIALLCAWSAGISSANRLAALAGTAAVIGLLGFNLFSFNASLLRRGAILKSRNEIDREAFRRIKAAASKYSGSQVILVNDHAGINRRETCWYWPGRKTIPSRFFRLS